MSHSQLILLPLCLLLIPYILHSQSISRSEVDGKADLDSAHTYAGQARALSHKLGDYRMEAKSLNLLGFINLESKHFHLAIAFQQAATNLFCPLQ